MALKLELDAVKLKNQQQLSEIETLRSNMNKNENTKAMLDLQKKYATKATGRST
jgi:hypothetical protein